jgi:TetR/AcrR family transcriptional regulator, transcriptional repressor for nem operon
MAVKSKSTAGPGRPREFNEEDVVHDAMEVFQTHGYGGTSIVELMEGTGLTRGSIYKAFSDKHTLFLAALERYTAEGTRSLRESLENGAPLAAIRAALLTVAQTSSSAAGRLLLSNPRESKISHVLA